VDSSRLGGGVDAPSYAVVLLLEEAPMSDMRLSTDEQGEFLARTNLAIIGVPADGRAPLLTPVLYRYDPAEGIVFVCAPDSAKAKRLRVGSPVSFSVQDATVKFNESYVTVEGEVESMGPDVDLVELRRLADAYFGPDGAKVYMAFVPDDMQLLSVRVRPTRWLSRDYTKAWGPQNPG
jgi:hypothetical protein